MEQENRNMEEETLRTEEEKVPVEEAPVEEAQAEAAQAGTPAEETQAEAAPAEAEPEAAESMDDYTEEIEASLQRVAAGDVMECSVVSVEEDAVTVDLDYFAPGKIPVEEMSADPLFSVFSDVQVGEKFRAVVKTPDDGSGTIILSKKEADKEFAWETLEKIAEEKTVIEGKISGVTNNGAVFYVEGIRGFIPASKLDLKYVEDTNPYLGKTVRVRIVEADKERKKLILSAKDLLVEAEAKRKLEQAEKLSVGSILEGKVERIMDYGAFVDIGNDLTGLLHISQISEARIPHPKAVIKEGQTVKVKILKVEDGKISLSMRAAKDAEEEKLNEEAVEYKEEYIPNNPFADLLKDIKLKD